MPADLCVALAHGGTFLVAAGFQHGVFAVLVLDAQHGLLEFFLLFQLLGVGEKVHLIEALVRRDLVGVDGNAPHRQRRVGDALKQFCTFVDNRAAQIGGDIEPDGAVRRFGDDSAVAVGLGQTTVAALVHVLPVVAHLQGDGFGHQLLFGEPEHQNLCHLPDNEFCFIIRVRSG